jgi:type IV pilus assembly protein PilY1
MKILFRIVLLSLLLFCSPFLSEGQNMTSYCQLPSSISTPIDPNVMLAIDVSGSMGWCAYTSGQGGGSCDNSTYAATTTYEGYFDPTKYYVLNASNVYVETTPTGLPCVTSCSGWVCRNNVLGDCDSAHGTHGCSSSKHACCTGYTSSGDCGVDTGNHLNYLYMRRIDILRWALTGGKPDSCNNSIRSCDPEVYPDVQLTGCDSVGCILLGSDGVKVKARWDRITGNNGGLLFQLKDLSPKPLMGSMFFQGSGITRTVYMGDFTGSASYDGVNPYKNTITAINDETPANSTPTAPALWDVYNYFAQNSSQYGGPGPQTGTGGEWKNPMNRCFDANNDGNCQGNEFELVPCAKNFVILMSDGQWNTGGRPVNSYCKIDNDIITESPDPVVPAYYMHKLGFTNSQSGTPAVSSYVESVYTVGLWMSGTGEQALKNVAMYGSFDRANTWPGGTTGYPQTSCSNVIDCCSGINCAKGSTCTALPATHSDWDKDGDGIPDTFFKASVATEIKERIATIILDILRHVSSGSAVSILSSSEGSGANLLQAVYYPKKSFGSVEIDWTGEMQNLWYYVDPYLATSSIREDTSSTNVLNLANDYEIELFFDSGDNKTKARRYSTNAQGGSKTYVDTIMLEDIANLWGAGKVLFERSSTPARKIYTTIDGSSFLANDFSATNKTTLRRYLNVNTDLEAENIINYIRGTDQSTYRNRTVTIGGVTAVWKLGDIVNSSPRIQGASPLNGFDKLAPDGYSDDTYRAFTQSSSYLSRGMSYIGANDGMLHAFKQGHLEQNWAGRTTGDQGRLTNPDTTTPLGSEVWAFIPKNALPYLQYLADPDYCHLYFVDAPSILIDASIEGISATYYDDPKTVASWKTVLIGGMGLGGASKITTSSCTSGGTGTCVKTPIVDPSDASKGLGYSSYFALDVTDPGNPSLLWEFSNPGLGFSTSGPAIVRIGDASQNGNWFAVFASGPTGPIETNYRQFLGKSDQNLKIFVVDLKSGTLVRTIDTGITNAFGGSLYNATIDTDKGNLSSSGRYSDDVFYLGYTQCADATCTATSTWTKGGVLRVMTKENADPANWVVSKVIDNIGPVTSAVTKLQDRTQKNLWLYFGSGRFFYRLGTVTDDASGQRALYGVKEPCYNTVTGPVNDIDSSCSSSVSGLLDQSSDTLISSLSAGNGGWFINLAAQSGNNGAERVITDPLAVSFGAVFFTTYTPSTGICSAGGNTSIWAVRYDTGSSIDLRGMAIIQLSTGAIHQLDLSSVFTRRGSSGGTGVPPAGQTTWAPGFRSTPGIIGMPPTKQGLSLLVGPTPMRKILQMKEK